ncbi:MAG: 2-hydroxychromene-2-carboxylate isomerase [Halieaceae bacterium]|jgi:2-hydroxychromene-2-carboxylate isomerase
MASTPKFEFFYDCSSPWTYFAFARVQPILAAFEVPIIWRPILVGGVFNAVNQQLYSARESMFANERRLEHYFKDIQDWAELCDIQVAHPSVFPVNSVKAMRGAIYANEQDKLVSFSTAAFHAYWGQNLDISQDAILIDLCKQTGLNGRDLLAATAEPHYKDQLRANTEELVERGGYGSPTMFINDSDMYFGNDRLPLVERTLKILLASG